MELRWWVLKAGVEEGGLGGDWRRDFEGGGYLGTGIGVLGGGEGLGLLDGGGLLGSDEKR